MIKRDMKKRLDPAYDTWVIHVAIWAFLMAIPAVLFHNTPFELNLPRGFFFISNCYNIALFYFNAYFLYPRLLTKIWWWLYLPALGALILCSYFLKLSILYLVDPSFQPGPYSHRILFFPPVPLLLASIFYRVIIDRIRYSKREKELRSEQLAAELKFLRSQVSPHFLFNMMTNMVALARKKSDILEPSLIKLSDLLRYTLYESTEKKSLLADEIGYLRNYIDLQQLRFEGQVLVSLDIRDESPGCYIEPLLLVPFVENAFKHGIGKVTEPFIRVLLYAQRTQLDFCVINSYNPDHLPGDSTPGIGLENVRNRLMLLYPERYTLDIRDGAGVYQINLKIDLS